MRKARNPRHVTFRSITGARIPVKIMSDLDTPGALRVTVTGRRYASIGYPYGYVFETSRNWIKARS